MVKTGRRGKKKEENITERRIRRDKRMPECDEREQRKNSQKREMAVVEV